MKRKKITGVIFTYSPYDFDGEVEGLLEKLKLLIINFPNHSNIRLEYSNYGYCSDSSEFNIIGTRKETDKEFEKRKLKNKKSREAAKKAAVTRKQKTKEKEMLEYKRLKKKYE